VAYVEYLLARIDRIDPYVGAFAVVCREQALADARVLKEAIRQGLPLGPLAGVPVAVKDNIDVEGLRTGCQSRVLAEVAPAAKDAEVVARLRRAGAIILGKLAMEEFAVGDQQADGPGPVTRNPWNLDRTSGGSSNGSGAAVAAGLVPAALGSDTGGSIRNPAASCGVVGMKPTFGLLSVQGVFPLAPSMDHIGVITRDAADNALLLSSFGADLPKPDPAATKGMRIGVLRHFYIRDLSAAPEIVAAMDVAVETFARLGATIHEVEVDPLSRFRACGDTILSAEAYAVHRAWLASRPDDYSPLTRRLLEAGGSIDLPALASARSVRDELRGEVARVMESLDVLVTAVAPATACRLDDPLAVELSGNGSMRLPFNVTGQPALAIPIGFDGDGMPMSMQIVGRHGGEADVYAAAIAYEGKAAHHASKPKVPDGISSVQACFWKPGANVRRGTFSTCPSAPPPNPSLQSVCPRQ
jgi:aspartyl-tRNA(Asn)/glutamyl-tRNA(Gln) amidotransferase subunit A